MRFKQLAVGLLSAAVFFSSVPAVPVMADGEIADFAGLLTFLHQDTAVEKSNSLSASIENRGSDGYASSLYTEDNIGWKTSNGQDADYSIQHWSHLTGTVNLDLKGFNISIPADSVDSGLVHIDGAIGSDLAEDAGAAKLSITNTGSTENSGEIKLTASGENCGNIITLLCGRQTPELDIGSNVTINNQDGKRSAVYVLDGEKFKGTAKIVNKGTLISNAGSTQGTIRIGLTDAYSNLTVENDGGTIKAGTDGKAIYIKNETKGDGIIKGGTIEGDIINASTDDSGNSIFEFDGCNIKGKIESTGKGEILLKGNCTLDGDIATSDNGVVNIVLATLTGENKISGVASFDGAVTNNGTYTCNSDTDIVYTTVGGDIKNEGSIVGGIISGTGKFGGTGTYKPKKFEESATFKITGGVWSIDPTTHVDTNSYIITEAGEGENKTWTVAVKPTPTPAPSYPDPDPDP
ncbi:MAG TPA: hypothetical protein DCL38_08565, partial [Lachnospiraceae bacterium]|nr:hypothetical protein [Lachnospiraceae bacterium]